MTSHMKKQENHKQKVNGDLVRGGELWTKGLICAFEAIRCHGQTIDSRTHCALESINESLEKPSLEGDVLEEPPHKQEGHSSCFHAREIHTGKNWIPIGWPRISQLLKEVEVDAKWESQFIQFIDDDDDDVTVADVAAPYWERPVGPTWWCHVAADHPSVRAWLSNSKWLHPAISIALRDESKLISERMKHLFYEVLKSVPTQLLGTFWRTPPFTQSMWTALEEPGKRPPSMKFKEASKKIKREHWSFLHRLKRGQDIAPP